MVNDEILKNRLVEYLILNICMEWSVILLCYSLTCGERKQLNSWAEDEVEQLITVCCMVRHKKRKDSSNLIRK